MILCLVRKGILHTGLLESPESERATVAGATGGLFVAVAGPCEVEGRFELDARRVRILPTGVVLLERLSQLLGQPLQIGKGGLREGIILGLLNGNESAGGRPTDPVPV